MSTGTKSDKITQTIEVDRDLLSEILETTRAAKESQRWSVADIKAVAKEAADSKMFGMTESQAFMLMQLAEAEGIHPVKALQRYHISRQGKPILKAEAALADFLKRGGRVSWITESDDREKCEAVFTHPTLCPEGKTVRFSFNDAKLGGVTGNDTWKNWSPAMLRARVSTIGVRMIDPAILAGMYSEEEADDIPDEPVDGSKAHHAVNHNNDTGIGSGAYAAPEIVTQYQEWLADFVGEINAKWLDHLTDKKTGEIKSGPGEIINTWQLGGHLLKWAKAKGLVKAPDDVRAGQRDKFGAVVWQRDQSATVEEATLYCREQWRKALEGIKNGKKAAPAVPEKTAEPAATAAQVDDGEAWEEGRE